MTLENYLTQKKKEYSGYDVADIHDWTQDFETMTYFAKWDDNYLSTHREELMEQIELMQSQLDRVDNELSRREGKKISANFQKLLNIY